MNAPKLPPHPQGHRCDQCFFWLKALAQYLYLGSGGLGIPAKVAMAQGLQVAGMPKIKSAPCFNLPTWSQQPAEMYCGQFKPNGDAMIDEPAEIERKLRSMTGNVKPLA